jgi:DNA mismatch repair protein MutS2
MAIAVTVIESLDGKKVDLPPPKATVQPVKSSPIISEVKPNVTVRTSQNTLDIRGDRVDEAESKLEVAINRANNAAVLWIIHGKGTGKLRQGVQAFLSRHPQVERFELASQEEGGAGVTLAYLR